MLKRVIQFLKKNFFPIFIVLITIFLSIVNYQPGTWLSGWDTLHPEFNFPLNFKRVIDGVWREEQGLGAVAGHSHMADLPRIFILWLLSFIFPISCLRYLYIFLCLIFGPLGVYYFINLTSQEWSKFRPHLRGVLDPSSSTPGEPVPVTPGVSLTKLAAFLGACFYLFNLGTLQHFYVPFEMFPTLFAALPWLFLLATKFLKTKKRSDLILFSMTTLLAIPMAYAAHLWYAFFLCFCLYLFFLAFKNWALLKKAALLILMTLLINSYWLLPNFYFLATHAQDVPLAKANRLFSEEAFLANKEFGTFKDTIILKNFLFNWSEHVGGGKFGYLLDEWIEHLRNPWVGSIGYLSFAFVLLGLFLTFSKREKHGLALFPVFLTSFIFIVNMNPPFERVFAFLRENLPLFKEGFRFPFTKFSLPLMFTCAVYFAIAQSFILSLVKRLLGKPLFSYLFGFIPFCLLVVYMRPAFSGSLISPSMKIKIPKEYFELFSWFGRQTKEGRVAHFPIHNLFGWIYYDWGYQGAGFLWFGIDKPFLDRDFDRWTPFNEEYYREMSYAVYNQNLPLLEKLFEKYQVGWVLVDKNVINPGQHSSPEVLFFKEIENLFSQSEKIKLTKSFGNLIVYETNLSYQTKGYLHFQSNLPQVESTFRWTDLDSAFLENGDYYSKLEEGSNETEQRLPTQAIFYPFRSFKSIKEDLSSSLFKLEGSSFVVSAKNLKQEALLSLPNYFVREAFVPADVFLTRTERSINLRLVFNLPQILGHHLNTPGLTVNLPSSESSFILGFGKNQNFVITNPQEEVYLGKVLLNTQEVNFVRVYPLSPTLTMPLDLERLTLVPELCSQPEGGELFGVSPKSFSSFEILAKGGSACINLPLAAVLKEKTLSQGALFKINFSYAGSSHEEPQVCLFNQKTGTCLADLNLDFVEIDQQNLDDLKIRFVVEASGKEKEKRITFENVSLLFYEPQHQVAVSTAQLERSFEMLTPLKISDPKVSLKGDFSPFGKINFDITKKEQPPKICGSLLPKEYDRRIIEKGGLRFIEYSSLQGAVCDFFEYPNLPHDQGYLLLIESRNANGLPLRVCLANHDSRRCDFYNDLAEEKVFKQEVFVIPPMEKDGFGYNLHFNNYSIGNMISVNHVKEVKILPLPYNWLKEIKLTSDHQEKGPNVLIFNQSFEKGWKLLGVKGANHVLVNNWANGWVIDQSTIEPLNNRVINIIYLPQYLEYLGFFLLGGTLVLVVKWGYGQKTNY